jgi:hypothetical protein
MGHFGPESAREVQASDREDKQNLEKTQKPKKYFRQAIHVRHLKPKN